MNFKRPLILASSSPRRRFLLEEIGFTFTSVSPDVDESFPSDMAPEKIPEMLALKKASVIPVTDEVIAASDTIVILGNEILNKPQDRTDAMRMLTDLSGKTHRVITAVCIRSLERTELFSDVAEVTFRKLTQHEIELYVDTYHPLDKAGSYGAQDCLPEGMNPCSPAEMEFLKEIHREDLIEKTITKGNRVVIIESIRGAYFTVMGLPIHKLYSALRRFDR